MLHVYVILYKKYSKNIAYFKISESITFLVKQYLKGSNPNVFKDFTLYHNREMSLP